MPFAAPMIDDENDPNKNPKGGVNISGQSTTVSTGVPGQQASSGKQQGSGQYANIQSYLDANKQQGDQMGTKIADDVSAKADDATQKIGAYESKAPTVQAYDPNEALGRVTDLNDQEKATYKTTKQTGGYTGPASLDGVDGYQAANKAGTEAASLVKNSGTEQGQRELLKSTYARPQYSAGENNLDQAIVQGSAGSRSKLESLGQKYAGLSGALDQANQKVGTAVNAATSQALANKQAFGAAEKAAREALINPLQARADQANIDNPALIQRILDDAGDETLSDETLRTLGLSEGQKLFDMNIGNYVNQNRTPVGLDNVASTEERQKYAALASLFEDPSMNQVTANGQAISPVGFNKKQFDADYAGKQAEFDRLAAGTTYIGRGLHPEYIGSPIHGWSEANVGSWLRDNNSIRDGFTDGVTSSAYEDNGADEFDYAKNLARENLYAQINSFLNSQNYNRTIKKG